MQNVYDLKNEINQLQLLLNEKNLKYKTELNSFLQNYFNGVIPKELPISKNQFISVNSGDFKIEKDNNNQLYWKTSGRLITVKDGQSTYGHSEKELYQGEYEKFSKEFKNYSVKDAEELTKPIFKIVSRYHNGADYANYGYQLCENKDLDIILIWRKGATAYINRGQTVTSETTLQIMANYSHIKKDDYNSKYEKFSKFSEDNNLSLKTKKDLEDLLFHSSRYITLSEGGRLSKNVISDNSKIINELFGLNATNNILTNLDSHLKRKKINKDLIKNKKNVTEEKPAIQSISETKEFEYNGVKIKV